MTAMKKTTIDPHPFARDTVDFLRQGLELLADLSDEEYVRNFPPSFESPIGTHVRHIVDHYTCFLDGLETGSIDYDNRARDGSVETDRSAAAAAMSAVVDRLLAIDVSARDRELAVHMDCGGGPDEAGLRGRSSVQRELQFLVSHTVHHYALVAVMLRLEGREPFDGFGVSPSTLKYQETAR